MAGRVGQVRREGASALVINRVLDSVQGSRCLWPTRAGQKHQVSSMLGPQDDALREVALGGAAPLQDGGPPWLPSGMVCTARPQRAGLAAGLFSRKLSFPPNNSSAWESVRVRDRLREAAPREATGDEFTPTAVPGGGRLGARSFLPSLSLFDFIAAF